jgi:hypothetical protein
MAPDERGGDRGQRMAASAQRALQRLSRLVEDHFLAERLDLGGVSLRSEEVPLRQALARAAAAVGDAVEVVAPDGLAVRADPEMLGRVLESAVAAAARGGAPVRAEATPAPGGALVRVSGAPLAPGALDLPGKGSPSDPAGRSLALVLAAAVARAQGASLRVEAGALVLEWAAPGRESAGAPQP